MNGNNRAQAGMEFLSWLKRFEPRAYSHVMSVIGDPPDQGIFAFANNLGHLGQNGFIPPFPESAGVPVPEASMFDWIDKAFDTAQKAIPAYFQYETQKDIMELNIVRAQQGQPPIDPGVIAPQIRHVVDVPPETREAINRFKMPMQIVMWGGVGLVAFMLLRALR